MFTWYNYTLTYITKQLSTTVPNFKIFLFLFRANDYFEDKEHECVITPPGAEYRYSQQMTLCWRLYACNYKINSELFINYQWFVFLTVSMFWSLASPKAISINHRIKMYEIQISFHSQAGQWHATFPWKVLTAIYQPLVAYYTHLFFQLFKKLGFQGSFRPSSISIVNIFSLYSLYNKNKKVLRFYQKKFWIFKI